jgi:polyisoprenoid-binding protein YceI
MKTFIKTLSLFLLLASFVAVGQNWKIAESKSKITFKIKNSGLTVDGSFGGMNGEIIFDPKALATASFKINVPVSTINTGIDSRDKHLKKDEYFDVVKYPNMQFVSTSVKATATGYELTGTLTIKGKSKVVTIPFTFKQFSSSSLFEGTLSVNRLDYGVGSSSWMLSDTANISLSVLVTP